MHNRHKKSHYLVLIVDIKIFHLLYVVYVIFVQYVFDYKPGDVFACADDLGTITGHSYIVYGPLCNGATTVLLQSNPTYPNAGT